MSLTGPICFRGMASTEIKQPYPRCQGQNRSLESLRLIKNIVETQNDSGKIHKYIDQHVIMTADGQIVVSGPIS